MQGGAVQLHASVSVRCSLICYIPNISTLLKCGQQMFGLFDVLPPAGTQGRRTE